jgi:hypothetical protein
MDLVNQLDLLKFDVITAEPRCCCSWHLTCLTPQEIMWGCLHATGKSW